MCDLHRLIALQKFPNLCWSLWSETIFWMECKLWKGKQSPLTKCFVSKGFKIDSLEFLFGAPLALTMQALQIEGCLGCMVHFLHKRCWNYVIIN